MIKKIHKKMKDSLWNRALVAIKKNPKQFLWMFLLDLGFLGVFILFNYLTDLIIPGADSLATQIQQSTMLMISIVLLFIVYVVLVVLAYSFFNLIILGSIKKFSVKHKHDFSKLKEFFMINLFLFLFFFMIFILLNVISVFLINKSIWIGLVAGVLISIILLMLYALHNFMHSAFILGHEFSVNLKKSFKHMFSTSYLGLFFFSFIMLIAYVLLYFIIGIIFGNYIIENYDSFVPVFNVITLIVVYLLFSFNRIYFYFISEKHIGHKRKR